MSQYDFPGHMLREQREALGLSLLDAYHETHVPIEYLTHLENGRLNELPATTYTARSGASSSSTSFPPAGSVTSKYSVGEYVSTGDCSV